MKKYLFLIIAVLILSNVLIINRNRTLRNDNDRLKINQSALISENNEYTGRIKEMNLTIDEFKENYPKLQEELRKEKIKVKYLQDMSQTATETVIEKTVTLRDTIYIKDTKDSVEGFVFDYRDSWNTIQGKIVDDTVDLYYSGRDTLTMMAYRVPKKFLFFNCGTKYIEVAVDNANPNVSVTYNRKIRIKKFCSRK